MNEFHYVTHAQEVIFGRAALARIGEAVKAFGFERLVLCTSRSVRAAGHVGAIEAALGNRLVAVFDQVQPHVQDIQVAQVLAIAGQHAADALIGMGGGSPIGMAKAVAFALEEKRTGHPTHALTPADQPLIPVVAIPTTYAGSEMTAMYGITYTRESPPRKVTVGDPKIAPKLVIYDPELTLDLPPQLTASTGINALAHCIEALYSITRQPLSTAVAASAVRRIAGALLRCYTAPADMEARTEMLIGAHLAGLSLSGVSMGLHHGLCHVLGGTANVPHGIANSIILPHAMRFNAQATAPQLLPVVEALGITTEGLSPVACVEAAAHSISDLVGQMQLPQHLREAGVQAADLPALAQLAFQNRTVQNNPRPITDAGQIENLLREAW